MRAFALFFAFYFAVLGCLSCAVEEICPEPEQATTARPAPHDQPAPAINWCSPLCQCHCCSGFAVPQALTLTFVAQPSFARAALRFDNQPTPAVPACTLATLWQPPQEV